MLTIPTQDLFVCLCSSNQPACQSRTKSSYSDSHLILQQKQKKPTPSKSFDTLRVYEKLQDVTATQLVELVRDPPASSTTDETVGEILVMYLTAQALEPIRGISSVKEHLSNDELQKPSSGKKPMPRVP